MEKRERNRIMKYILLVFLGGGIGSVLRYLISLLTSSNFKNINPISTLISNILSVVLMGIVIFYISEKIDLNKNYKLFILTGICGGFSTFSTFSLETFTLLKEGYIFYSILNVLLSITLTLGILFLMYKKI